MRERWRATHRNIGDGGIAADRRCRHPCASSVSSNPRQPALQADRRWSRNQKSEVQIAACVRGQWRINQHVLLIHGGIFSVVLVSVKDQAGNSASSLIRSLPHDYATGKV